MSGVLSLEVREQMLCSGLCNSAATSIVYLFTSFLGSDVNVETRCIVHRVNIHILICTLIGKQVSLTFLALLEVSIGAVREISRIAL